MFPGLEASTPWSDEELTFVNSRFDGEPSVIARGLGGSITGFRADVLIVDDLIDKTNVMTQAQRDKVNEFWDEIVVPTLNPDGRVFIVGCLTADTRVSMADGSWKYIVDCEVGDRVVSYDSVETVEAMIPQGKADVYRLKTRNHEVEATSNHPFLCERDGRREFVKLEDLKRGDYIICNHKADFDAYSKFDEEDMWDHISFGWTKKNQKWRKTYIQEIEYVGKKQVYDLTVSNTHNFIANGLVVHNTRYHHRDWYARILETPEYQDNLFIFPAFTVDERGREVLDEETGLPISYWPERWPSEALLQRKSEITYKDGSLAWSSQYMADPSGYEGRLFKTDWLEMGYYTLDDDFLPKYGNMDYFMSIDPNISEDPKSDNTAICTLAVDRVHKDIYVLDFYARPLDFLDQVRVLNTYASRPQLRVGKDYLPGEQRIAKIGVEAVAYQKSLQRTGYVMGLPVVPVTHTKMDKITRILRLQPHFENLRIKLPHPEVHRTEWWDEFYDEYTTFPRSRRDDLMDSLEVAVETSGVAQVGSGIPGFMRRTRYDGRPEAVAPWKEDGYRGILTWQKKRNR